MCSVTRLAFVFSLGLLALGSDSIDSAQREALSIHDRTRSASSDVADIHKVLDAGTDALADAIRGLDRERQQRLLLLPLIDTAIQQAQAEVEKAEQALIARAAELKTSQGSLDEARTALGLCERRIESARQSERNAFAASKPFKASVDLVESRTSKFTKLSADLEVVLTGSPAIAQAQQAVDKRAQALRQLRNNDPPNEAAIAAASRQWIDAKNKLTAIRRNLIGQNQPYAAALDELRLAQGELAALKQRFEDSLDALPAVAEARKVRDEARKGVGEREVAASAAQSAAGAAHVAVDQSKTNVVLLHEMKLNADGQLRQIQASLDALRSGLSKAAAKAESASKDLSGALTSLRSVTDALDSAESAIASARKEARDARCDAEAARHEAEQAKLDARSARREADEARREAEAAKRAAEKPKSN